MKWTLIDSSAPRPWFHRRPLFWWGLAAIVGVILAYGTRLSVSAWLLILVVSWLPLLLRQVYLGTALVFVSVFGVLTAQALKPPSSAWLRNGASATVRGVVERGRGGGPARVLHLQARKTPAGWVTVGERIGFREEGLQIGDVIEVHGRLERPLPPTNPGALSARLLWLRRGVHFVIATRPDGWRRLGRAPQPWWTEAAERLRARILELNRSTLSAPVALIANSLLIGETEAPDPDLQHLVGTAFRDSGTIHLLVVSGTQVTLVMGIPLWLARRFWPLRYLFWVVAVLTLGMFYLMTQGDASVTRAALMGCAFVLGPALSREADGENCLGLAALLLLLVNPLAVFDVGAQLSFLALWSLVRLQAPLKHLLAAPEREPGEEQPWHEELRSRGAALVAGCLAPHLAVAPLLALHFQRAAWVGVIANVVVASLATALLYLLIGHITLSALGLPVVAPLVEWAATGLLGWARFFAQPGLGAADVFPVPVWMLPLCLLGIAVPSWLPRRSWGVALVTGGLAGLLVLAERVPTSPPAHPTLRAIDVGQGDCLLLQTPGGRNILVDTGPDRVVSEGSPVLRNLRAMRIGRLDAVVVSHEDADHIGELAEILAGMPVDLVIHGQAVEAVPEWEEACSVAARRGIPLQVVGAGDRLHLGDSVLTILGPMGTGGSSNAQSLVARWDCGDARVLLTGDADGAAEEALLPWDMELRCGVLKVVHHGSRNGTGTRLLQAVAPQHAVVSAGRDNRYGHPHPATLERLHSAGAVVHRTDQGGMLTLTLDGDRVRVERYLQ